jgi:DNA-binding beta-propeller fold protein YncE
MSDSDVSRRQFCQATTAAAASTIAASTVFSPFFVHAADKTGQKPQIMGTGDHQYECQHNWGQLPDNMSWNTTHGVTFDKSGMVYIIQQGSDKEELDTIVVFDPNGKFVRSFGKEFHGGGHGIDIREEDGVEYLYICDTFNRQVVKTTLDGEWVFKLRYPREAHVYKELKTFSPTNVAFDPDGSFFVADGYGSSYIHKYDRHGGWLKTIGTKGKEPGQFTTPHGLWVDTRKPGEAVVVVSDRSNARLQTMSLEGEHKSVVSGFALPCSNDTFENLMVVADLRARVTLVNENNEIITHFGYDEDWSKAVTADKNKMRSQPERFENGRFIHPHDAAFDKQGNIFVAEWIPTGRISKLRRV